MGRGGINLNRIMYEFARVKDRNKQRGKEIVREISETQGVIKSKHQKDRWPIS